MDRRTATSAIAPVTTLVPAGGLLGAPRLVHTAPVAGKDQRGLGLGEEILNSDGVQSEGRPITVAPTASSARFAHSTGNRGRRGAPPISALDMERYQPRASSRTWCVPASHVHAPDAKLFLPAAGCANHGTLGLDLPALWQGCRCLHPRVSP
jgi:hypothetical protein